MLRDGASHWRLFRAGVEGGDCLDESEPGLLLGGGVVTNAAGDDEELARSERDGAAIGFGSPDREAATEDEEHLVLMLVGVPGEFAQHFCHLDVLVVDLTDDSR